MPYGIIKVDTITFTDGGADKTVSISGLVQNPTFSGNITVTGTISGNVIRGGTTVSGATVTGTAGQFGTLTGNTAGFTTITGATVTGTVAQFTTITGGTAGFTTVTGATVTGTTANFTTLSGTTVTGNAGSFTTVTGGVATITSGVFAVGAEALPSISFASDPNTGIYSPGADQVAISTGGSGRLFVDANGNVGVGNSTPVNSADTSTISIGKSTTGGGQIEFKFSGAGRQYIFNSNTDLTFFNNNGATIFSNGGFERVRITSAGLVGVGTSAPGAKLTIQQAANTVLEGLLLVASSGSVNGGWYHNGSALVGREGGFDTINLAAGKVGIGTTSPSSLLHLSVATAASDGTKGVRISNPAGTIAIFECGANNDSYVGTTSNSDFSIRTNNTSRIYVTNGGNVGIGTTSPTATLEVKGGQIVLNTTTANSSAVIYRINDVTKGYIGPAGILGGSDNDMGYRVESGNNQVFYIGASERARLDSSGRLLVGTSTARANFFNSTNSAANQIEGASNDGAALAVIQNFNGASNGASLVLAKSNGSSVGSNTIIANANTVGQISFQGNDGTEFVEAAGIYCIVDGTPGANDMPGRLVFSTTADGASSPTERMIIKNDGIVLINTTQGQNGAGANDKFQLNSNLLLLNSTNVYSRLVTDSGSLKLIANAFPANLGSNSSIILESGTSGGGGPVEIARFRSDGKVGIGTASPTVRLHVDGDATTVIRVNGSSQGGALAVQRNGLTTGIVGNLGTILGTTSEGLGLFAETGLDIRFFTNGSATERARFNTNGDFCIGNSVNTSGSYSNTGSSLGTDGFLVISRSAANVIYVNRKTDDGQLMEFAQADAAEGSISVSGTTVSYNGAHLSRWSQLLGIDPHDKTQRPEILRGTVMSNLDEMCDWIDPKSGESQDNEQLNKTKISDIEGDKNVAGVFQSWDDDDETWVNDYYLAVTGDFVIRIAGGVTVERGNLLMSAGDGTAKPQADDAVRSCTVAKVTSTHISHTFDDGSYCVPCVLMAC